MTHSLDGNYLKLQTKGTWINKMLHQHGLKLDITPNGIFDDFLEQYENYLIDNYVCPQCYKNLTKQQSDQFYHGDCGLGS
jgi:hypothetical protein